LPKAKGLEGQEAAAKQVKRL